MIRIAINGFGRIGRKLTHLLLNHNDITIVAINDLMTIEMAVYFLKYDSTFGVSNYEIEILNQHIKIANKEIFYSSFSEIEQLKWSDKNIDIIINCSGTNKTKFQLEKYLTLGVEKVILSSPPDTPDIPIVIMGYNNSSYSSLEHKIVSNGSCTTYCVAPILDIINTEFGVEMLYFTTIHSYTSDQNIQDSYHVDFRRSRAAANNIIPTTTSATKVIKQIFPKLALNIMGTSFRVPVINGSITEFVFILKRKTTTTEIIEKINIAILGRYKNILSTTNDPIVSSDILGCPFVALIDMNSLEVLNGTFLKLTAYYDNESGYSNRLIDLIHLITQ